MKKHGIITDNRGFSLVELIVVVLITGILMLAVVMFISTSRSAYQTVNTSATMQEEAISVERVLSEYIMEASECGFEAGVDLDDGSSVDVFWVRAKENDTSDSNYDPLKPYSVYCFVLDKAKERIMYTKDVSEHIGVIDGLGKISSVGEDQIEADCTGDAAKYHLIGKHIIGLKPTRYSRGDGSELICLNITYSYMGKEYKSMVTAATRNKAGAISSISGESSDSGDDI